MSLSAPRTLTGKSVMEHQILRRKLLEEHKTFQSAKEEEECPRIQARIAVSKSKTRYDCAACTRSLSPLKELLSTAEKVKSGLNERAQLRFAYPMAVLNAGDHFESSFDRETSLKGTPWEEAIIYRDTRRLRKRSGQERLEERQSMEFLELFG